jgi:PAS domain S-box-containing protein
MGAEELEATDQVLAAAAATIVEQTADPVAVVSVDEAAGPSVVFANEAACALLERAPEDVHGGLIRDLQPEWVVDRFAAHARQALAGGRPVEYQAEREVPAGRTTYLITVCPLPELGDDPPHVLVVARDVTAIRRVTAALSETQELAHIGHWVWDVAADEIRWSNELYRIYGLERGDFEASYDGFLEHVHPDDRDEVDRVIRDAFQSGGRFSFDHRIVRPDGEVRTLAARGEVTLDEDGQPIRMAGTGQDVTELRRAEELERGLQAARRGQQQAAELTETVVQRLTEALLAFEADAPERGVEVVRATLEHTRAIVNELLTQAGARTRLDEARGSTAPDRDRVSP